MSEGQPHVETDQFPLVPHLSNSPMSRYDGGYYGPYGASFAYPYSDNYDMPAYAYPYNDMSAYAGQEVNPQTSQFFPFFGYPFGGFGFPFFRPFPFYRPFFW